jgi:hypothetical protein
MYLLIAFLVCINISYSQTEKSNIEVSIQNLKSELKKVNKDIEVLASDVKRISSSSERNATEISKINSSVKILAENVDSVNKNLDNKIILTGIESKNHINELGGDVEKNRLYWIIATLVTLLLGTLMYLFLGKRIKSNQTDVESQIRNTKKSLEEESLKLDNKLIEVLETKLKVQQEVSESLPKVINEKVDHSLALKVADEIVRMQKNISRMDADIKGLKPLEKGIERIQANFAANGYEMTDLLNKKFDDRMTIEVVNVLDDESLPKGEKLISRVIRPQVLFNGVLIQRAQVEVSQN